MKQLAIMIRCLQLFSHNAHNLVGKVVFFQDHEFLGELYTNYEEVYDSIIERIIGLSSVDAIDLVSVQIESVKMLQTLPSKLSENSKYFEIILQYEKELCKMIPEIMKMSTEGTKNLLADIADKSEQRQYKLQQRLRK